MQIRQYFKNETFYADDVVQRGLCAELSNENYTNAFTCEAFSPAAATVKVSSRSNFDAGLLLLPTNVRIRHAECHLACSS